MDQEEFQPVGTSSPGEDSGAAGSTHDKARYSFYLAFNNRTLHSVFSSFIFLTEIRNALPGSRCPL
jgi:hypothetical protein